MHYELNRKTLKILANEPTRTLLEKQLIDLCLRQYERLSQRDNDNNDLKQTLIRVQNAILSNCPWIVETPAWQRNGAAARTQSTLLSWASPRKTSSSKENDHEYHSYSSFRTPPRHPRIFRRPQVRMLR